jgi:hypothetical protein
MMPGCLTTIETTAVHGLLFPSSAQKRTISRISRNDRRSVHKPRSDRSACPFRDRRKKACYAKGRATVTDKCLQLLQSISILTDCCRDQVNRGTA